MTETTISDVLTDAIRYWEMRRIAYNVILIAIVLTIFVLHWPESQSAISVDLLQRFFILAVLANVAYCTAYVVDIAVQSSAFRASWKRYRWVLFAIGVVFASIIARFIAAGIFSHAANANVSP
jgi:hypothetical protein